MIYDIDDDDDDDDDDALLLWYQLILKTLGVCPSTCSKIC